MSCAPSPLPRALGTGILHLGLGAFHRAHQAPFTEEAVAAAGGDWGIEAVAMRSPAVVRALAARGHRYTLIERRPEAPAARVISVIRRCHLLPEDPEAVAARMADPAIRIVTLTVTEKAYGFDPDTRRLDPAHPAIAADLARPESPRGPVGLIVRGLALRRAAGGGGLTVMSCDNLAGNGRLMAGLVAEFARRTDPALADWIAETCRFPDSMVDRITPAPTAETAALAAKLCGAADPAAVETEPFRQWVIEDAFAGPRPAWEAAGALIVPDVAPFEAMKLRMLNGAHSFIACAGTVAGLACVRDVVAVPPLARLARRIMDDAAETLPPLPGLAPADYAGDLMARFANPAIAYRCAQIATDSSQKLPQRQWAATRDRLEDGRTAEPHAFATAAWIRHLAGRAETGAEITLDDPLAPALRRALAAAGGDPAARVRALAGVPGLAHHGLFEREDWVAMVARHLAAIEARGLVAAAADLR